MDAIRDRTLVGQNPDLDLEAVKRPTREEAMEAVRTLIAEETRVSMLIGVAVGLVPGLFAVFGASLMARGLGMTRATARVTYSLTGQLRSTTYRFCCEA